MKNKALLLFFLCCTVNLFAQKEDWKQKIRNFKIAFITEHMDFSPDEASKFWPVYNDHDEKIAKLRHEEIKKLRRGLTEEAIAKLSEKQAQDLLAKMERLEKELFEEEKAMNDALRKILPAKKIMKLKKVEDDFNRELIHILREKKKHP